VISDNRNFSLIPLFKNSINQAKNLRILFPFAFTILKAPATLLSYCLIFCQVASSIAWLKLFWLMAESQISLLYRCWIGLEPHQPI